MWVDPRRLAVDARTVAQIGDRIRGSVTAPDTDLPAVLSGSATAAACAAGSQAATRAIAVLAAHVRAWAATADRVQDGFAGTDDALAVRLNHLAHSLSRADVDP